MKGLRWQNLSPFSMELVDCFLLMKSEVREFVRAEICLVYPLIFLRLTKISLKDIKK
jgi:hypothetical protein